MARHDRTWPAHLQTVETRETAGRNYADDEHGRRKRAAEHTERAAEEFDRYYTGPFARTTSLTREHFIAKKVAIEEAEFERVYQNLRFETRQAEERHDELLQAHRDKETAASLRHVELTAKLDKVAEALKPKRKGLFD